MYLLASYKSVSPVSCLAGEYSKKGKDFEYRLVLREDGTFFLGKKYQDANPQCNGKWHYDLKGMILLNCNEEEDFTMALSKGYMNKRNQEVRVINQNTLLVDNVIVKKDKKMEKIKNSTGNAKLSRQSASAKTLTK